MKKISLALHGGAGTIMKQKMTADMEYDYRKSLQDALEEGYILLEKGGSALEAVTAVVCILEDNPLFNAGKGSVFTHKGKIEMDASIMEGATLEAGAIASVAGIKNPILAAREVMLHSEHVFLAGAGAEDFARERGLKFEEEAYFFTEKRWKQLQTAIEQGVVKLDHDAKKYGTVGAVALDSNGNLAAATSTGGMTNKKFGRIGDSPLIGAGTYANNQSCAVSCTGHGEYFMRLLTAIDVSQLMLYKNLELKTACNAVLEKLTELGGSGGFIAVDKEGNIEMPFISSSTT